ncbi:hypothetical protein EC973_005466 [Apophysomyces ossiformis]|uniref:Uncharacterized protein n=1 Tax=Apophysomyces ossiformis TaxID=679940 RepID=A0A8H7BZB9_9FUNG|nr:hypothetical protein EC973_005466 [Apophysomyces ossiformis]
MESHAALRSLAANPDSSVVGLSLNKHGIALQKLSTNRLTSRIAALPPLNLTKPMQFTPTEGFMATRNDMSSANLNLLSIDRTPLEHDAEYFQRRSVSGVRWSMAQLMEACHTLLFSATLLQRTLRRILTCIVNDGLTSAFTPILQKAKSNSERLAQAMESPSMDLVKHAASTIATLKELCLLIKARLSTLVQVLEAKYARHLLLSIHGATVDMKEVWEVLAPLLTGESTPQRTPSQAIQSYFPPARPSPMLQPTSSTPTSNHTNSNKSSSLSPLPLLLPAANRGRSHSEQMTSPIISPLTSPNTEDSTSLFNHLKLAVMGSLSVVELLKESIEEALATNVSSTLAKKLNDLARIGQHAAELTLRLDKALESMIKDEQPSSPSRKELSRRFWEDTNGYLKAIVSVMSSIRAISTEEEFVWPKTVKQGCLHVTRVTAEVAKLWNSDSVFAEDGYYLGGDDKQYHPIQRSVSSSEQTATSAQLSSSPSLFAADAPMNRKNSQTNSSS